jgi:hypothetical protein
MLCENNLKCGIHSIGMHIADSKCDHIGNNVTTRGNQLAAGDIGQTDAVGEGRLFRLVTGKFRALCEISSRAARRFGCFMISRATRLGVARVPIFHRAIKSMDFDCDWRLCVNARIDS